MATFTDKKNGNWAIDLTIGAVRRVKSLASVDLLKIGEGDPPLFVQLVEDIELQGMVLWAVIEPQARERGIEPDAFAELLGATNAATAFQAFRQELISFFHALGREADAKAIEGLVDARAKIQTKTAARMAAKLPIAVEKAMADVDAAGDDGLTPGN